MPFFDTSADEKVGAAWNAARGFVEEIQNALSMASYYYQKDKYFNAFKCLHSARMRICQYFDKDELKKCREYEAQLRTLLGKQSAIEDPEDHKLEYNKLTQEIYQLYCDYNDELMRLIRLYGLGIPDKDMDEGLF